MSDVTATRTGGNSMPVNGARPHIAPIVIGLDDEATISCDDSLAGHRNALFEALAGVGKAISTPFPALDGLLEGGFSGGRLYVIAGAPRAGKTTLAAHCLDHAAAVGHPCLYVGYADSRLDFVAAALARRTGLAFRDIRAARLDAEQAAAVADSLKGYLAETGRLLTVWQARGETGVDAIADWLAGAKHKFPERTALVVVDPMLLAGDSKAPALQLRGVELKDLARSHDAVVIGLTSLAPLIPSIELLKAGEDAVLAACGLPEIASADGVLALHGEPIIADSVQNGINTKLRLDPWQMAAWRMEQAGEQRRAVALSREIEEAGREHGLGGKSDATRLRLALVRHGGACGDVFLHFRRATAAMAPVAIGGGALATELGGGNQEAVAIFRGYVDEAPQTDAATHHDEGNGVAVARAGTASHDRRRLPNRRHAERRYIFDAPSNEGPEYRDRRLLTIDRREGERRVANGAG